MSDDFDDEDENQLLIDLTHEVTFVRLVSDTFMPCRLRLRCEVFPGMEEDGPQDFDIVMQKIRFWLDTIVPRVVAFSRTNPVAAAALLDDDGRNRTGNALMLCPDEPTDLHLAPLFQAKMNALADNKLHFGSVELASDNISGLVFTYMGHHSEVLPQSEEWLGERNYFDKPWWERNDASTMDVTPGADANLEERPSWAFTLDFLEEAMSPQQNEPVILHPKFRPEVIDGGKSDDE